MLQLTINGTHLAVAEGTRVLVACRQLGIDIPTLCWLEGHAHFTSCMICVVKDVDQGRLIPACSALVTDGMRIETDSEEVHEARRVALELLLSEHVGDCEAPCRRVCPRLLNIPRLLRCIQLGDDEGAMTEVNMVVDDAGAIYCDDCKAPCEKACRRGRADQPIAIRRLIKFLCDRQTMKPLLKPSAISDNKRFDCTIGPLQRGDLDALLAGVSSETQVLPQDGRYTPEEAQREAARCLRCDCRKPESCKLRVLAETYGAHQRRYRGEGRRAIQIVRDHSSVVFEPGKCIRCGICVRLLEAAGVDGGLTFLNRGIDTVVGMPFGDSLQQAVDEKLALQCVDACPTGALARREGE